MDSIKEYLITAQGYHINDPYKQNIILHETVMASAEDIAKSKFTDEIEKEYKLTKIFSATLVQ